jgi:hypothetical protein
MFDRIQNFNSSMHSKTATNIYVSELLLVKQPLALIVGSTKSSIDLPNGVNAEIELLQEMTDVT